MYQVCACLVNMHKVKDAKLCWMNSWKNSKYWKIIKNEKKSGKKVKIMKNVVKYRMAALLLCLSHSIYVLFAVTCM